MKLKVHGTSAGIGVDQIIKLKEVEKHRKYNFKNCTEHSGKASCRSGEKRIEWQSASGLQKNVCYCAKVPPQNPTPKHWPNPHTGTPMAMEPKPMKAKLPTRKGSAAQRSGAPADFCSDWNSTIATASFSTLSPNTCNVPFPKWKRRRGHNCDCFHSARSPQTPASLRRRQTFQDHMHHSGHGKSSSYDSGLLHAEGVAASAYGAFAAAMGRAVATKWMALTPATEQGA